MKIGIGIQALAQEVLRQRELSRDLVVPQGRFQMQQTPLRFEVRLGKLSLVVDGASPGLARLGVRDLAHDQLAGRLKIPRDYYRRMKEEVPELLCQNVNSWLASAPQEKRMLRTVDGQTRAILSNRYRPLDNAALVEAVLPILGERGLEVHSAEITERRLYIQAVNPRVQGEVVKGDVVQAGVCLSNSEVGCGALQVDPLVFRLVCLNGMIAQDHSMRRFHLGGALGNGANEDNVWEVMRDETRRASDKALWMQVQDVTRAALDEALFSRQLQKMQRAAGQPIERTLAEVVETTGSKYSLLEGEKASVLQHLAEGGSLTRWGLVNAITGTAHDVVDYDRSVELERVGGELLEVTEAEWRKLAAVA